jgi:cell division protein FtsA
MALGRTTSVGIDIGTSSVKVIVSQHGGEPRAEKQSQYSNSSLPRIIGAGTSESKGLRHGYITNIDEAAKSIRSAVSQAEKTANMKIRKAYVSVGGVGVSAIISTGSIITTKADTEITDLDVKRACDESEKELPAGFILNRRIIHIIPLGFRIDGKKVLGRPQGMKGVKLEARVLYITCLSHHLTDLLLALEEANIEVEDVMASAMAASLVTLTKTQKIAGCVLANIGSETTSIIVFEDNIPVSMEVFPFGSNDVTNDIALGLKVSIEEAENIKLGTPKETYSKKKLDEIVVARLSDIFDLIEDHLTKIDRNGLLPAGIVITGGGAGIANIEELAKAALRLPSKQSKLRLEGNLKGITRDFEWAVAYGLTVLGNVTEDNGIIDGSNVLGTKSFFTPIFNWLKKFLP